MSVQSYKFIDTFHKNIYLKNNMPKKIITMVLYNRPDYTKIVLDALRGCTGIGEYLLRPHIEPGNGAVVDLVKAIDFVEVESTLNPKKLGIGRNTYLAWDHGFKDADFIVHLEDDTVPSPDCLQYMEFCRDTYRHDQAIFSVTGYNRCNSEPLPTIYHQISRRCFYHCWIVGLWGDRWNWIKNNWSPSPGQYGVHLKSVIQKHGRSEIFPLLSRSQNIGAERGVHVPSAEWHREHHYTKYWAGNIDIGSGEYNEISRPVS
jgi:hypothetical protein